MPDATPDPSTTFGEFLRYLRRRIRLTQKELGLTLGYSEAQVARLESGQRLPDPGLVKTTYVEALGLQHEPALVAKLVELAALARQKSPASPATESAPTSTMQPWQTNLPCRLTPFVGRERELAEVKRLVASHRLVTLTGAGGVGKTRLASEAGAALVEAFADGVWLADLTPLTDAGLVPRAVAAAFGLPEQPVFTPLDTLTTSLREKHLLLILDGCEHLVQACAELAVALLRTCPKLGILATSREALRVSGEQAWRVQSLTTPDFDHPLTPEQAREYEAVRLFMQHAASAAPDFQLAADNVAAVARICQQLDGIPLAIEMAAAQVAYLSAEEIAAGLRECFTLLDSGDRTAPLRHRTLRAALDWSYNLLSGPERALLARLSVFVGGWTLEAARAICGEVASALRALVCKSLVVATPCQGVTRFSLLETVRQYAAERLHESGEAELTGLRDRHLAHYLALTEETMDLGGWQVMAWVRRVDSDHDNLRAAFAWAHERVGQDQGERMLRLAAGLRPFRFNRGYLDEGMAWLDEALRLGAHAPAEARARALLAQATALINRDSTRAVEIAREGLVLFREVGRRAGAAWCLELIAQDQLDQGAAEEALRLFREVGSPSGASRALRSLGRIAQIMRADRDAAARFYEEAYETARAIDDRNPIGFALRFLYQVNPERARVLYAQEVARARGAGDDDLLATVLLRYGEILLNEGEYGRARDALQESMDLWRKLHRKWSMRGGTFDTAYPLGMAYQALGETELTARLWEELLPLARELGYNTLALLLESALAQLSGDYARADAGYRDYLRGMLGSTPPGIYFAEVVITLSRLGGTAYGLGQGRRATRLLGAAVALAHQSVNPGWTSQILSSPDYTRPIADARSRLGDPALAAAWAEGQHMTLEQAVACALTSVPDPIQDQPLL
jgi:predicted ATPase